MKKSIRLIIIVCAVLILLGGAVAVLLLTAPEKPDENIGGTEEELTSRLIYDKNQADLEQLDIENEYGVYSVLRIGEGESAVWMVPDLLEFPLTASSITKLVENASSLTVQQVVNEKPDDISIYGLDPPVATVTAKFSDSAGTVKKIYLGNSTPNVYQRYIMIDGDPTVYTAFNTAVGCFADNKEALISKVLYNARTAADENDMTDYTLVNKMTVTRANLDYDVDIEYDARLDEQGVTINMSSYIMTSPLYRELSADKSTDIMQGMLGLTAEKIEKVNPTDADFKRCGISEAIAEVYIEMNGGDIIDLFIGAPATDEDGEKIGRYVYNKGIEVIYVVDEVYLPWLSFRILDIVSPMYNNNYIYYLTSLDIKSADKNLAFTFTGSSADDFAAKLDGKDIDLDAFKKLYQFILSAPSSEMYFEDVTGEPLLTIEMNTSKGKHDLIEFIPCGPRQVAIKLNGKVTYKCAETYINRFMDNIERYENGEELVSTW